MKVLVTGAKGFMGKHMCLRLRREHIDVFEYDLDSSIEELKQYVSSCDFIIHLAGVNRPEKIEEFYKGNVELTNILVNLVKSNEKNTPIIYASSTQATLDNDYGRSKKQAEEILFNSGLPVYVYRLTNAFGKWGRPNYNSAVATFCYNIAHDLPVYVRDENYVVHYNYIDDIIDAFMENIGSLAHLGSKKLLKVEPIYDCSLGKLVSLIRYFKQEIESDRHLPLINNEFELKLFKMFCNYLSDEGYGFNYTKDNRGSFEELYKSKKWGQISENVILPGITKGGHYHKYKKEIFETVVGETKIILKDVATGIEIINNSKDKLELVDIIPNYIHEITNVGNKQSHTIMWINEIYDESKPDTYR